MRETMQVPPLSDILREAASLGVRIQPDMLPASAALLYKGIYEAIIRRTPVVMQPKECLIALDTTMTLCAEHAGERLVPSHIASHGSPVTRTIRRCFDAYGVPPGCLPYTLTRLQVSCFGGIEIPTLKDLSKHLRNERIRRDYRAGADCASLVRCYGLSPRRIRDITTLARN